MAKASRTSQTLDYRFDDSVGYLLARARMKLGREMDEQLAEYGVTQAQAGILLMLCSGRFDTAAALARELYMDSAAMTRMIDRLEKRGLLRRVRREDDRRAIHLQVTPEGTALGRRLPGVMTAAYRMSFGDFSDCDLDGLRALLRRFLGDEKPADTAPRRDADEH